MTLYFIGLGLNNEKDITINGLDAVKKCDIVYLENYTSVLNCKKADLEEFYGKKIILARRNLVEEDNNEIKENTKKETQERVPFSTSVMVAHFERPDSDRSRRENHPIH